MLHRFRFNPLVSRLGRFVLLGLVMCGLVIALPSCTNIENTPLNRLRLDNFRTDESRTPTLVKAIWGVPKTFNYLLSKDQTSSDVLALMYSGLVKTDAKTGDIVPELAKSWTISEDGKKITFKLREGLKWSDGAPLTADDVVFTFNDLILNEDIPTDNRDVLRIGEEGKLPSVKKLDDLQVEFTIPEPFAPFLRVTGMGIMPKHILKETVEQRDLSGNLRFLTTWGTKADPSEIIGNGPYTIKQFVPGERIIFQRNPYYWDDGADGKQPYIAEIVWPVVGSGDAEFVRFRSGETDLMNVTPDNFKLIKEDEEQGNYTVYNGGPTASRLFLTFNLNKGKINDKPVVNPTKSAWFNQVEFRQAVAYAIDRDTMLNNIFKGLGELQNSQIAPQSPYYADSGLKAYDYDIEQARELLTSAGFVYKGNDLYDAAGNRVAFTVQTNVGNKIREFAGVQIKQNLAQLGMNVTFRPIDFNTLVENLDTSLEWDAIILGFGAGVEPNSSANLWLTNGGLHLFNQQPTSQPPLPGREVYAWEKKISDLYVQAAQELDETKRKALYVQAQQLVQEQLPFIHLVGQYQMAAVRNRVENVDYTVLGGALWNIEALQLTQN